MVWVCYLLLDLLFRLRDCWLVSGWMADLNALASEVCCWILRGCVGVLLICMVVALGLGLGFCWGGRWTLVLVSGYSFDCVYLVVLC